MPSQRLIRGGSAAHEWQGFLQAGAASDEECGPRLCKACTCALVSLVNTRAAHGANRLALLAALAMLVPGIAVAGSPFATGANATQAQLVAILTPLAAVAVMVSGVMAWFGRISWWWMVGVVLGTVLVFGGPQIVSWIRGMFGV
ncbi:TrbC/VirB2 family protein [Variovorax sp. MHTC-1]|uniref:TrbC/VirB2 family protein n=1 Tax=Variovorax sp. MHTC-1 TaxID=2495593 RepID=UPI0021AF1978|nr:TrbC/VirB2 family protein [Variovorax sp. MHTC-1]